MEGRPAPSDLGKRGRALWEDIIGGWALRADEYQLLQDACRTADLIVRMERELQTGELTVKGAYNQRVSNPVVSEIRQHRNTLKGLLGQLKLTDPDVTRDRSARISEQARKAARTRWGMTS